MMKILHSVHNYFGFSGASKQAKNIALNLKHYYPDIEQRFFSIGRNNETKKSKNFIIHNTKPSLIKRCITFIFILFKYKPDLVHFHGADFALLIICKLFRKKIYWKTTLLGSDDFSTLVHGKYGYIKKSLLKLIDINNTLTKQIYRVNSQHLPLKKLVTIPNGVNIPESPSPNYKEKMAIIVSAIIPRKSILEGISFFKKNLSIHGYKLYIIGPNNAQLDGFDDEYYRKCLLLSEKNIIFTGELSHEKTLEYFRKSHFLIHLAKYEGMPNVVLEAMAHSVFPIVSSMRGLADELIENNITGFNIDSMEIFYISNFPSTNNKGREFILRKNSFQTVAKRTHSIYSRVLLK
ncbi:putative galactosyltransferase [Xenorhabdus beddingii]|uniref:Putative galactosyltransferase n=1 Tax=Xenorhabdus beddingii TaxID=40578 RepID=A0A1Y2SNA5_9GAMM|nr:glycosyltransferase family 4 protein [Xenorhabdus beddingii]OTA19171.1 putative galactosyltransferase [Xenorhabdus beddingii]